VATFEHWLNGPGPQFHTLLAVSAMVRTTASGQWRRLDSRALYRAAASVGERYTGFLLARLSDEWGVGVRHREGCGDRALPESRGISDGLVEAFSSRAAQVDATLARLVGDFADAPGPAPDRATTARLARQAVLMERPASEQRSWADQREHWLVRAAGVLGVTADQVGRTVVAAAVGVGGLLPADVERSGLWAVDVLARLEERGAAWSRRDIGREAAAMLREAGIRVTTPRSRRSWRRWKRTPIR